MRTTLISLLSLLAAATSLVAQSSESALLAGQVVDPSGSVVQGATVQIIETNRNISHTAITDSSGRYTLPDLEIGPYRLEVTQQGFKQYVQTSIVLHVGDNRQINVKLVVGDKSDQVEVVGGANLVQTEQSSVSQIISQKNIVELPLNGRQPTQLVLISGAAVVTPAGDMSGSKNYFSSTTISVAGGQGNGTNYILDGGDNTDIMTNVNLPFPFPDALQEFGVETSALPARNGSATGGVVTVITKSGSNDFHGDLFEFLRNGDLNARNTFAATQDTLKRNQFGGTAGGKIITDKLYFFGGYQGTRIISTAGGNVAYVPTALELAGNFSVQESSACQSGGVAHAPLNKLGFVNNQLPASLINPVALNIVKLLPGTSNPCGKISYTIPNKQNEDQYIGRIDWLQSAKNTLFGRYYTTHYLLAAPFNPNDYIVAQTAGQNQIVYNFTLGDSYTFAPNLLDGFHATFTRRSEQRGGSSASTNIDNLGSNLSLYNPNYLQVSVSNDFGIGCGTCSPAHYGVNNIQLSNDLDWIKGAHHFTFGGMWGHDQYNLLGVLFGNGSFTFNGSNTGDPMADFLTGTMSSFSQSKPQELALRQYMVNLYAQDTIQLRSNLVLNAGVRWEPYLAPFDRENRGSLFSMADFLDGIHSTVYPTAPAGLRFYGDQGVPKSILNNNFVNVSPRLGLVWDPSGKGMESLRVGAGLMYDPIEIFASSRVNSGAPYGNEIDEAASARGGLSNPWVTGYNYPGGNPFPPKGTYFPQYALFVVPSNTMHNPSVAQWDVSYQRQLGPNWVVSASYIANKTTHLWVGQEMNPAIYSASVCAEFKTGCTTANTNQRKFLEQLSFAQGQYYGNLERLDDGANASYNGLLVSANHRLTHGISFLANYTWSHCISEGDFAGDISAPTFSNPSNLAADRGDCNFDIRHIANLSLVKTTAWPNHGFLSTLVSGWQIAPLVRATSGIPLNVVTGTDNSRTGVGLDRPNLVTGVDPYADTSNPRQYLVKSAFKANAIGTLGDLGRDALRSPGALNVDLSVTRLFSMRERYKLEVRGEAFNVINKVNYLAPATGTGIPGISSAGINLNLSSSSFGQITSAGDPRILQVAMKLSF